MRPLASLIMFGKDNEYLRSFENAIGIDPGDAPPSSPPQSGETSPAPRRSSVPFSRTKRIQPISSRQSLPGRLIPNDLALELAKSHDDDDQTALTAQPSYDTESSFDLYDEENNKQVEQTAAAASNTNSSSTASPRRSCHSLPTIDEARSYAATLLYQKRQSKVQYSARELPSTPTSDDGVSHMVFQEESAGDQPSKHILRKQLFNFSVKVCVGLFLLMAGLFTVASVMRRRGNDDDLTDTSAATGRFEAAMQFLTEARVSKKDDLLETGSPQNLALKWIVLEDAAKRPVPDVLLGATAIQFAQRYSLATFYFATGGPTTWKDQLNFLNAVRCSI